MNFGIDAIAFDVAKIHLPINTLANNRNIDPEKLEKGLGLLKMTLPDTHQDTVVFGANALTKLIVDNAINLEEIKRYVHNTRLSKRLCFLREAITDMNFGPGSHTCNPKGRVKYSSKIYTNKHMNYLGLNYYINKITGRYERSHKMRERGWSTHYTGEVAEIEKRYKDQLKISRI